MSTESAYADWLLYILAEFRATGDYLDFDDWWTINMGDYPEGVGSYESILDVLSLSPDYIFNDYSGTCATPQCLEENGYSRVAGEHVDTIFFYTPKGFYYPVFNLYQSEFGIDYATLKYLVGYTVGTTAILSNYIADCLSHEENKPVYPDMLDGTLDEIFIGVVAGSFEMWLTSDQAGGGAPYHTSNEPYQWEYFRAVIRQPLEQCVCDCGAC